MKKYTKKVMVLILFSILLSSTALTAYAASCPPHSTYPLYDDVISTSYSEQWHYYYFFIGVDPDGNEIRERRVCNYRIATDTILWRNVCSKCGQTVGTYTTQGAPYEVGHVCNR